MNDRMKMKICVVIMAILSTTIITITSAQGTSEQSSTSCKPSIETGCSDSINQPNAQQLQTCCVALKDAADTNRKCFCLLIHDDQQQSTTTDETYNKLFAICSISGTVDTLCSGPNNNSSTVNSTTVQTPNTPTSSGLTPAQIYDTTTQYEASGSETPIIVGIICIALLFILISFTICLIFICKKKSKPHNNCLFCVGNCVFVCSICRGYYCSSNRNNGQTTP